MLEHGSGQSQTKILAYPCFNMSSLLPSGFGLAFFCFPILLTRSDVFVAVLLTLTEPFAGLWLQFSSQLTDALCDIIWHFLLIDNKVARREQTCSSNSKACPGDIFHSDLVDGRPAFFDVTVRNTVRANYICEVAEMAGATARAGAVEKDYKHEQSVLKCGGLFYPLVLKSFGFWTQASLQTLRTIAAKTTTYNGIDLQQVFSNLCNSSLFDCGNTMLE